MTVFGDLSALYQLKQKNSSVSIGSYLWLSPYQRSSIMKAAASTYRQAPNTNATVPPLLINQYNQKLLKWSNLYSKESMASNGLAIDIYIEQRKKYLKLQSLKFCSNQEKLITFNCMEGHFNFRRKKQTCILNYIYLKSKTFVCLLSNDSIDN